MMNISTKSRENIFNGFNVAGVTVLVLCTSSDVAYYMCIKFHENILNGFEVIEGRKNPNYITWQCFIFDQVPWQ